jgi:hypothetical protein
MSSIKVARLLINLGPYVPFKGPSSFIKQQGLVIEIANGAYMAIS